MDSISARSISIAWFQASMTVHDSERHTVVIEYRRNGSPNRSPTAIFFSCNMARPYADLAAETRDATQASMEL